jgi:hypothetical protein
VYLGPEKRRYGIEMFHSVSLLSQHLASSDLIHHDSSSTLSLDALPRPPPQSPPLRSKRRSRRALFELYPTSFIMPC